jgi:hypothetical protein
VTDQRVPPGLPPDVLAIYMSARRSLEEAAENAAPRSRYLGAHLAALRAASSVVAARGVPSRGRKKEPSTRMGGAP